MNNLNTNNQNNIKDVKSIKELVATILPSRALLMAFFCILLCAYMPISTLFAVDESKKLIIEGMSLVAIAISVFAFYHMVGSGRQFVTFTVVSLAAFLFLGATPTALVLSLLISICLIAHVLLFSDNTAVKVICTVAPIVAYLSAALLTNRFFFAATALLPLPIALALTYSMAKNLKKVSAVCYISVSIICAVVGFLAIRFIVINGTDFSIIPAAISTFRENVINISAEAIFTLSNEIADLSMTDAREIASVATNTVFNLLPALIVTLSNILAFSIHSLMLSTIFKGKVPSPSLRNMFVFDMSSQSAYFFLGSFFLAMILSASGVSVWSVTAENVSMILMPAMILTAIMMLKGLTMAKGGSCLSVIIYFVVIFMLFYMPSIMLPLASVAGAVTIILHNIAKLKIKK